MGYRKGQSGNPNGRPKGIMDRRVAFRSLLESRAEDLVKKAIELALAGDGGALRACLDRICPPLKARGEVVALEALGGSLVEHGQAVVAALGAGTITPDEAATIMQALSSQARILEVDELERRVKNLEDRWAEKLDQ
jgi:hypothetical protein